MRIIGQNEFVGDLSGKCGETHVAERFMMTVNFTVGSNIHQVGRIVFVVISLESGFQLVGVGKVMGKRYAAGKGRVIEKYVQPAFRSFYFIGFVRRDRMVIQRTPVFSAFRTDRFSLPG